MARVGAEPDCTNQETRDVTAVLRESTILKTINSLGEGLWTYTITNHYVVPTALYIAYAQFFMCL